MAAAFGLALTLASCLPGKAAAPDVAAGQNVVTADIQAGIERYLEDETLRGNGYFKFTSGGKDYSFRLVRVHTEYLSNLGPRRHFACVDLVDTAGDVYDVDFFLAGDPGAMQVTETTLHKLNGIPFYAWKRMADGTWSRVAADSASQDLLDVVSGQDTFEFHYSVELPELSSPARIWIPFPRSDSFQSITLVSLEAPANYRVLDEQANGNQVFFLKLEQAGGGQRIEIRYRVERKEKAAYASVASEVARHLQAERLVPLNDDFRRIAEEVVRGKHGDLVRARALYDHVIEQLRYMKFGPGWGRGDAVYACDMKTGNCTDYHAYFIALARSIGIPARFAIGAAIPASRDDGGIDGYHCWAEFHAEGKWWPVDISEADKYTRLATYYFGHQPANRIEFSRGRDLMVEPLPASGPINFLAYPVLEIGGVPVPVVPQFSFTRL